MATSSNQIKIPLFLYEKIELERMCNKARNDQEKVIADHEKMKADMDREMLKLNSEIKSSVEYVKWLEESKSQTDISQSEIKALNNDLFDFFTPGDKCIDKIRNDFEKAEESSKYYEKIRNGFAKVEES